MKSEPSSESAAVDPKSLIDELAGSLRRTAEDVVPWFLENMPPVYFQDTRHDEQLAQLRSILAAKASGRPLEMVLKSENDAQWTMMAPVNRPGVLASMTAQLPEDFNLWSAKIHSAKNGELLLVIFESGDPPRFDPSDPEQAAKLEETIAFAAENFPSWTREEIEDHFSRCTGVSIRTLTPLRICRQRVHFLEVSKTENTTATLEEENDPDVSRIVVTVANSRTRGMLERVATRLARADVNIFRAYLDRIEDDDNGFVNMLGFVVRGPDGKALDPASQLWQSIRKDLLRLKWIDRTTLDLAYSHENLSLTRAEIIMSLCHLVNHILVKRNPYAFDRDRILRHAKKNFDLTTEVVDLFLLRFNPERPLPDEDFESHSAKLHERIDATVDLEAGRTVMHALVDAVGGVMRTNVFLRTRYALSMRIRPDLLQTKERPELPYGVFFVHGRSFNGFHVRFRDIARGGIRAVRTIGSDQHTRECERLYDEVYGLAFAQQLKNKDIPEGGSKGVVLIEPGTPLRRSVQAFVDSLLDLITPDPATRSRVVDLFGQPELLYFGPDENISPEMIEWVVKRAKQRGYPMPTALMSSKPGAGINHKTYGVTSEGVNVFLRTALESIGIKPTEQPFRVSITGGPDGDVAGNMIRILDRDYSGNARIVGIADGSGVGEDPDGLDHEELLRLFREGLPIASFDRSKVGPRGRIVTVEEPEGVQLRNTMHFRVAADAFVPGGGRPATIHGGNWKDFLDQKGRPLCPVIVEGANLFLTPDARSALSDRGCLIIKDSSANKCGVITSSFEIAACMLLDEEEFLAIKEPFVQEVLERLRHLARREADLLLRMRRHQPDIPLFELSIRLSKVVITVADAIAGDIEGLLSEDAETMHGLVTEHLPPALVESAGERLWTDLPPTYVTWIMAKTLAARIVYREGFELLEHMSQKVIARGALRFLRVERERRRLAEEVRQSGLNDREEIASLLERAGILGISDET